MLLGVFERVRFRCGGVPKIEDDVIFDERGYELCRRDRRVRCVAFERHLCAPVVVLPELAESDLYPVKISRVGEFNLDGEGLARCEGPDVDLADPSGDLAVTDCGPSKERSRNEYNAETSRTNHSWTLVTIECS